MTNPVLDRFASTHPDLRVIGMGNEASYTMTGAILASSPQASPAVPTVASGRGGAGMRGLPNVEVATAVPSADATVQTPARLGKSGLAVNPVG